MTNDQTAAYMAFENADRAWHAAIVAAFPKRWPGDVRYQPEGMGSPGTALRAAYDEFHRTRVVWDEARTAGMVTIYI